MKGDFIVIFLEILKDMGREWSQIPYKGFRYSDFNRYGYNTKKRYFGFKNLEQRGLIKNKDKNKFIFTKNGYEWLKKSHLRYFKNKGKWDKKWRVVIFDVPQELHLKRVKFRNKLKSLGFVMLQKSVFTFPYPCHEEIGDICKSLNISDYVDIIIAESVGFKEKELIKIFDLKI